MLASTLMSRNGRADLEYLLKTSRAIQLQDANLKAVVGDDTSYEILNKNKEEEVKMAVFKYEFVLIEQVQKCATPIFKLQCPGCESSEKVIQGKDNVKIGAVTESNKTTNIGLVILRPSKVFENRLYDG